MWRRRSSSGSRIARRTPHGPRRRPTRTREGRSSTRHGRPRSRSSRRFRSRRDTSAEWSSGGRSRLRNRRATCRSRRARRRRSFGRRAGTRVATHSWIVGRSSMPASPTMRTSSCTPSATAPLVGGRDDCRRNSRSGTDRRARRRGPLSRRRRRASRTRGAAWAASALLRPSVCTYSRVCGRNKGDFKRDPRESATWCPGGPTPRSRRPTPLRARADAPWCRSQSTPRSAS